MTVEYFPELKNIKSKRNKYGIMNLSLVKDSHSLNGYSWRYSYYDVVSNKIKRISSNDLIRLRKKVEEQGFDWRVINLNKAKETYDLNRKLVIENERIKREHRLNKSIVAVHTISKCGVQYVYSNNRGAINYWTYRDNKHQTITRKTLKELEKVVKSKGYDWIVKDKFLYETILAMET